ncbi:MAG: site-specific integrase [Beijerinckiaceae bacterium]
MQKVDVHSLPPDEWPPADRLAWEAACRPGIRLRAGGRAAHLKQVSQADLARHYGRFLDHLVRTGKFDSDRQTAALVTERNIDTYLAELKGRVSSVTQERSIDKVRQFAAFVAPEADWRWLSDLARDLALAARPRPRFAGAVDTALLVEAGLTLVEQAQISGASGLERACMARNGLMVALLAVCPIRLKNFSCLAIGKTLVQSGDIWWIVLSAGDTKAGRADERPVPDYLGDAIRLYIERFRPLLLEQPLYSRCADGETETSHSGPLWISSNTGLPLSYAGVGRIIADTTLQTVGHALGPHMFRVCAASTAAFYPAGNPNMASALLQHTDARVTEKHYNRARSVDAGNIFADIVASHAAKAE